MTIFKDKDAVFCPMLSVKPLIVFTKNSINGVFIKFRGGEYWFTVGGVLRNNSGGFKALPSLFKATEDNQQHLSTIYDMDFESTNQIKIYAVNETNCYGEATNRWLYHFRGMYCSFDMSDYGDDISAFKKCDILMSPNPSDLEKALSLEPFGKIICIGHDNIHNWANEVADEG